MIRTTSAGGWGGCGCAGGGSAGVCACTGSAGRGYAGGTSARAASATTGLGGIVVRHAGRRSAALAAVAAWALLATACAPSRASSGHGAGTAPPSAARDLAIPGGTAPSRRITTASPEAQRAFDEGLLWTWSFNHDEAVRWYRIAVDADPDCAMAWWGIALCRGPHINNPVMDEAASREAWEALGRARAGAARCTPVEQALIEALGHRYADPGAGPLPLTAEARAPLDRAYADAMGAVAARWPADDDVLALRAESLMDLHPWDLWSLDGRPGPDTPAIITSLETVLARSPNHAGANHLYIHAVEGGPNAERADASAERLRTLVPGSGHMVHMPAHIDVRMGRWNLAADQNIAAIEVDRRYTEASPRQGFYRVYMLHDQHFLAYACMMAGRRAEAISAARAMLASVPEDFYRDFGPLLDPYTAIEIEALMRFGRWDELLALPAPREQLPVTRTIWRCARGVALAAKGDVAGARREQALASEARALVPPDARMANNPAGEVLAIADELLEGEILYRTGDIDGAAARLRAAIAIEDRLRYIEPPDWVQPVRHTLGAILLEQGRVAEAAEVYREDLRRLPENGWSLRGLAECCRRLGRAEEAADLDARFARAWSRADIAPGPSCLCVTERR